MNLPLGLVVLLGALQGATEFLPVSSSGHLRLLEAAWGIQEPQTLLDVALHGGTLIAVLAVYHREVWQVLRSARLAALVVVGSVPAAVVGLGAGGWFEAHLSAVWWVGLFLVANGFWLWMAPRAARPDARRLHTLGWRDAMWVGLAQAFALLRGVSRSGTTIVAGLRSGLDRDAAAAYSFLLSIPAVGGALVLELVQAVRSEQAVPVQSLAVGGLTSAVVGYAALRVLLGTVRRGQLHGFGPYCWAIGAAALVAHAFGWLG